MSNTNTSFGASYDQSAIPDRPKGLPSGKYPLQLIAAERAVSAKNKDNWYIKAKFRVIAGPMADSSHFENYNLGHTREDVKKFALADLKSFAAAIGYAGALSNMDPFFNKPFLAEIKATVKKDDQGNEQENSQIKKYEPIAAYSTAPVAPVVGVVGSTTAPAANTTAPWKGAAAA